MRAQTSPLQRFGGILLRLLLVIVLLFYMFPLIWMVLSSLKTQAQNIAVPPLLFFEPTFDNYARILAEHPMLEYTWNSFIIAAVSSGAGLLFGLPVAYSIARYRQNRLALTVLIARMVPGISYLVPWFIMFSQIGITGTYSALALTHLTITLPLTIWIMIGFFEDVPEAIEESAALDGAPPFTVFVRIAVPLVRPGIAAAFVLSFIQSWNMFMYSVVLGGYNTQTLPVAVFGFLSYGGIDWGALTAAATLITLPVIVLALLIQKNFVAGLTFGGLKE